MGSDLKFLRHWGHHPWGWLRLPKGWFPRLPSRFLALAYDFRVPLRCSRIWMVFKKTEVWIIVLGTPISWNRVSTATCFCSFGREPRVLLSPVCSQVRDSKIAKWLTVFFRSSFLMSNLELKHPSRRNSVPETILSNSCSWVFCQNCWTIKASMQMSKNQALPIFF